MAYRHWLALSGLLGLATACADDAAGAVSAEGTGGSSSDTGGETAVADTAGDDVLDDSGDMDADGTTGMVDETTDDGTTDDDGTTTGPAPECLEDVDCDDNEPCTEDDCKGTGLCEHTATETTTCRPAINVIAPVRGATLMSGPGATLNVLGNVTTGYGTIESLTLNGGDVAFDRETGAFNTPFDPGVGGNLLLLEVTDSNGWERRRVQSLLWSTNYREPTTPMTGTTDDGIWIWLDQETIDDGDHSQPIDDVATVMQMVFDSFDLSALIDPTTPVASNAGYNVYVTGLDVDSRDVTMTANDTGVHVNAVLGDVSGPLVFDCTILACELAGGDGTGDFTVDSIEIDADLLVTVNASHELDVTVANAQTSVVNLDITSDNIWTNFLITIIEPFIIGGIVSDLEAMLTDTVTDTFGPMVEEGFSQLDLTTAMEFPNLGDPSSPISVQLETDFASSSFDDGTPGPQGGLLVLRAGGYTASVTTPYDNLGVPDRVGCDQGQAVPSLPLQAPVEIGLTDDTINQLMFAGWRGGLLEFPLEIADGAIAGATDVEVSVTGRLAPTVNDCNADGELRAHIGDLQITASMTVLGAPIDFVAYTTMELEMEIDASGGGIEISFPAIEWIETELTVEQDNAIELEGFIKDSVESTLEEQLLASLGAGGFSGIALPSIDLSAQIGLPAGSAVMNITVDDVEHQAGITVINGHL